MYGNRCTHNFTDGHRCGSPAMRGEHLCYFHHPTRRPVANPYERRSRRGFDLPAPRNRQELQQVLGEVITRLASNRLDVHRAGLLLYCLQLAGQSLDTYSGGDAASAITRALAPVPDFGSQPRRRSLRASGSRDRGGTR